MREEDVVSRSLSAQPREVVLKIMLDTDPDAIFNLCRSNTQFAAHCRDDRFWRAYYLRYVNPERVIEPALAVDGSWRQAFIRNYSRPVYDKMNLIVLSDTHVKIPRKFMGHDILDVALNATRNYNYYNIGDWVNLVLVPIRVFGAKQIPIVEQGEDGQARYKYVAGTLVIYPSHETVGFMRNIESGGFNVIIDFCLNTMVLILWLIWVLMLRENL